jgi:arylsulfatase A-like enzyme
VVSTGGATGKPGTDLDVLISSVTLASDFDRSGPDEALRVDRQGIQRTARPFRTPVRLRAPIRPEPRGRLRVAVAVAGTSDPVEVQVRDEAGRLPPQRLALSPDVAWTDLAIDLAPLDGESSRLVLECLSPDPGAVLLVSEALLLAPTDRDAPDVVLYLVDTLRADWLGTYGHARTTDPFLETMARDGVVVESLVAAANWTRPSTTSILTSLDPLRHGNQTYTDRVSPAVTTLAEQLAEAGYLTTSFVTNHNAGAWSGLDQGFDVAREPTAYGASSVGSTLTSAVLEAPLEAFLEEHADEQVFVYVHSMDPHQPYLPPMEDLYPILHSEAGQGGQTPALSYEGEIHHNDRMLAQLDSALDRLGLREDTLFVVTSDHGEAFGEHGVFTHRTSLHQEQLLVPWVLRWPAGLDGGRRIDAPLTHVDIAPSLLGLLGLAAPDSWQGLDVSDVLRGEPGATAADRPILVHTTHGVGGGEYEELVAVIHRGYKLVARLQGDAPMPMHLYYLGEDPAEARDLVDDPAYAAERDALRSWATEEIRRSRAAGTGVAAEVMDPEQRRWMEEMGYLR